MIQGETQPVLVWVVSRFGGSFQDEFSEELYNLRFLWLMLDQIQMVIILYRSTPEILQRNWTWWMASANAAYAEDGEHHLDRRHTVWWMKTLPRCLMKLPMLRLAPKISHLRCCNWNSWGSRLRWRLRQLRGVTSTGIKPYGAFVSLENGTHRLIHISEIKTGYIDNIHTTLKVDQEVLVCCWFWMNLHKRSVFLWEPLRKKNKTSSSSFDSRLNYGETLAEECQDGLKKALTILDKSMRRNIKADSRWVSFLYGYWIWVQTKRPST